LQYKEALQLVQAAIRLVPSNGRYRHSLGVVHEAAEEWAAAAAAFERAVEKRPNDSKVRLTSPSSQPHLFPCKSLLSPATCAAQQARMHLARALKSAGQPGRAVDVYKSLLQLQPDHPTAHFKLGSVLRHMGRHEAAAEAYRCAFTHTPADMGILVRCQEHDSEHSAAVLPRLL
jgi:Flp pilus assembly protein TadD